MRFVLFIILYTTVEEIISEQLLLSYGVVYYAVPNSLVADEILSVAVTGCLFCDKYIGQFLSKRFKLCFHSPQEPNILAWIFEKLVIAMIVYFLLSIINSMAQHYAKRLDEKKRQSQKPAKGE